VHSRDRRRLAFNFASATSAQIKESKWAWEPFLYDQRPLKGASDASLVQNRARIHLEVVEVLDWLEQVPEDNRLVRELLPSAVRMQSVLALACPPPFVLLIVA
jgi:hypothetical protein